MLTYRDIMTKEVVFYEEDYNDVFVKFCKARNINFLPAIHDSKIAFKYSKSKGDFDRFNIEASLCVEASESIFKSIAIKRFKLSRILFVKEFGDLVGVVHYCDYNRPPVFEEIYKKLYKLERGLLYLITEYGGKSLEDLEKFMEVNQPSGNKAHRLLTKQDFRDLKVNLSDIMRFANEKQILIIRNIPSINQLRNKIAHSNDLVTKEPLKKGDLKYNFEAFRNLIEGISALDTALRQVANRAYIMKVDNDEDYELKVSKVFDDIFS